MHVYTTYICVNYIHMCKLDIRMSTYVYYMCKHMSVGIAALILCLYRSLNYYVAL